MNTRLRSTSSVCALLTGVCVGALAMYYLDPQTGKRRRALVRDQVAHAKSTLMQAEGATRRDLVQRASGMWSVITSPLRRHDNSDEAVNARVRSRLGRLTPHAHAIESKVEGGRVVLSGRALTAHVEQVLDGIRRVAGVTDVESRMSIVETIEPSATSSARPSAAARVGEERIAHQ